MNALFVNGPWLDVRSRDGRNFVLIAPKEIRCDDGTLYRMPAGADSDGASTPGILWGPPEYLTPFGDYWPAAYAHDCAYRDTLQKWAGGEWIKASLTKEQSDDLLKALMFACGTAESTIVKIYEGVALGGGPAFAHDRSLGAHPE